MIDDDSNFDPVLASVEANKRDQEARHRQTVRINQMMSTGDGDALFAIIQPAYRRVLDDARQALTDGNNVMAVVLAHAGAEICTEATIAALLGRHNLGPLAVPLGKLFRPTDICRERLREIWNVLGHDEIEQRSFWQGLVESRTLRHRLVHKGEKCTSEQAYGSVEAVARLIEHLEQKATAVINDSGKFVDQVAVNKADLA